MKMSLNNILLCTLLGFFALYQSCSAQSAEHKVVGGQQVTNRTQFPFQASLRRVATGSHFCGAVIVGRRVLLTAAHCVVANTTLPSNIYVVVGDLNRINRTSDTIIHYVENFTYHEEYNRTSIDNDVAVIIIRDEFTWTPRVNYLQLPDVRPPAGTNCTISGWGTLSSGGNTTAHLMYAVVPIVSTSVCSTNFPVGRITDGMVCAGYMEGGVDTCQGDSGGPLACNGRIVGIVSWGNGCAFVGFPGVYADVAYYRTWIENTINGYLSSGSNLKHGNGIFFFLLFSYVIIRN